MIDLFNISQQKNWYEEKTIELKALNLDTRLVRGHIISDIERESLKRLSVTLSNAIKSFGVSSDQLARTLEAFKLKYSKFFDERFYRRNIILEKNVPKFRKQAVKDQLDNFRLNFVDYYIEKDL